MDKKIKVGIIGCGGIATWTHVPGYKAIPDMAEVYALCDIDEAKLRKKGEEWGVPVERQFTDYKELIKSGIVDCVDICTPNHVHCEIAHAAIDAGLPFSIEKPIGLSYDEALKLSEAVEKSGVPSFVCFSWRYREYTRYVRDIIKSGKLGKIYHIYVKCIKDSGLWEGRKLEWRFDKDKGGTGVLGDLGSHMVDIVRFWGEEFDGVFAQRGTEIKERMREDCDEIAPVTTDDWCNIIGKSKNGIPITIELSRVCTTIDSRIEFDVMGENGRIRYINDHGQFIESCFGDDVKTRKFENLTPPESYEGNQSKSFIDMLCGRKDQYTSELIHGMECQKVLEAAQISCDEQKYIRIEDVENGTYRL